MQPVWGYGHMHHEEIVGLDSPSVRNVMISISSGQTSFTRDQLSTIKLWKMSRRDRSIMVDRKFKMKVLTVSMHPSGHIFAVNFEKQIKLLSIVGQEFYQLTSQKNIHSMQIRFSHMGHFLVSLENGRIKFYDPFTLKSLCYIEPQDLKLSIVNFRISKDDQYIFFECSDYTMMRQKIDLRAMAKSINPSQSIKICHKQSEQYTTYFYQPKISEQHFKFIQQIHREKNTIKNLFIGFTKKKYITLYKNEGEQLITQFSVVNDCYITDIQVLQQQKILFAATSKGSIRVYNWPILQCHCLMQVTDVKNNKIRLQPPFYNELQVWLDKSVVKKIHKIKFSNQLVITNQNGNLSVINFQLTRAGKLYIEETPIQRKKLMKSINDYYFVRASELEKREKLIEKTENDILKVENQILRQKNLRENHLLEQQWQIKNAFSKKNMNQGQERKQCALKQQIQVQKLKRDLQLRRQQFDQLKEKMKNVSVQKKDYEKNRNQELQLQTIKIVDTHKQKIKQQIERHKNSIRFAKQKFQNRVKSTQIEFNKFVNEINQKDSQIKAQKNKHSQSSYKGRSEGFFSAQDQQQGDPTVLVKIRQNLLKDEQNEHIGLLTQKVDILERQITKMKQDYNEMMQKVYELETQDEILQKQFQSSLENYNQKRFANLCMHSQVLKMQNQLIQRRQILQNKDKVISMVYNEKYRLQNYKQLVKGALTNIQKRKQELFDVFVNKENDLSHIFTELVGQIKKYDKKKLMITDLEQAKEAYEYQNKVIEKKIEQEIINLRQLKKFLLLEGSSEDNQQKQLYQQRQNIQGTINWLKKRLHMAGINEKKNINLKKTSLGLVLRQNQNLLEECNQLRSQGIEYQNEIKNISNKLRQANNIISLEAKLRNQKDVVQDQKVQLDRMKILFDEHLNIKPQQDKDMNELLFMGQQCEQQ